MSTPNRTPSALQFTRETYIAAVVSVAFLAISHLGFALFANAQDLGYWGLIPIITFPAIVFFVTYLPDVFGGVIIYDALRTIIGKGAQTIKEYTKTITTAVLAVEIALIFAFFVDFGDHWGVAMTLLTGATLAAIAGLRYSDKSYIPFLSTVAIGALIIVSLWGLVEYNWNKYQGKALTEDAYGQLENLNRDRSDAQSATSAEKLLEYLRKPENLTKTAEDVCNKSTPKDLTEACKAYKERQKQFVQQKPPGTTGGNPQTESVSGSVTVDFATKSTATFELTPYTPKLAVNMVNVEGGVRVAFSGCLFLDAGKDHGTQSQLLIAAGGYMHDGHLMQRTHAMGETRLLATSKPLGTALTQLPGQTDWTTMHQGIAYSDGTYHFTINVKDGTDPKQTRLQKCTGDKAPRVTLTSNL